ncbi:hypothetical protein [Aquipuribacter sp. SD81]|uniref:hypothetical protein n=1 Tax=Aquipuribacter sp. SD81 TaxID=3127703 RepID=UPI003016792B
MSDASTTLSCGGCGAGLPSSEVIRPPEPRTPCSSCGSLARQVGVLLHETVALRDGVGYKAKHAGDRKPYREAFDHPETQRSTGALTRHKRLIDRQNDRYFERVVEEGTGRVVHETDHPLTEHRGHGSDRGPRNSPPPQVTTPDASPPAGRDGAAHGKVATDYELDKP